jgi:hypothetical protein
MNIYIILERNSGLCSYLAGALLEPYFQPPLFFFFCSGYFGDRDLYLPRLAQTTVLLFRLAAVAGMTDTCHHTQLFLLRRGLVNLLPGLGWNHNPPTLSFLSS